MNLDQHVIMLDDKWALRGEGNRRVTSIHDTKNEAIQTAKRVAKVLGVNLFIHGERGVILDSYSYSGKSGPFAYKRDKEDKKTKDTEFNS